MKADRVALGGVIALVLWAGFYVLGFTIAGALLLLPWAQNRYQGSVSMSGLLSGFLAVWVLWAIFPRPGASPERANQQSSREHPRLHAFVADIAERAGMRPPDEVHVIMDANAYAAWQSGWRGARGANVVGVGIPLLALLDCEELASVVAHELGHHHAGHVRLGPWVHRMRRSIGESLYRLEGSSFWLHWPFVAYARLFLRVTHDASRSQEFHADAIAARVCGATATASALCRIHDEGALWQAYFASEVRPLLRRGYLPPILEGFDQFRNAVARRPDITEQIDRLRAEEERPSALDTHPTLSARLTALQWTRNDAGARGDAALALLDSVESGERTAVEALLVDPRSTLKPIEWVDAGEEVWLPMWRESLELYSGLFDDARPARLGEFIANAARWASESRKGLAIYSPAAERRHFANACGAWLAVELHRLGFVILALPGAPVLAKRGVQVIEPFNIATDLDKGAMTPAEWRTRCEELQL
ncbi:MAG: M48 family metalloprotease [Polyangiaceae bacterium]|nr:M48 family metalloprotease [Polyangiaceae bacterium]